MLSGTRPGHKWQVPPIAAPPSTNAFFGKKRAGCLSPPKAGEFLTAPKKAFARGKPKAKLHGHVSFGTFLCAKEKYADKQNVRHAGPRPGIQ
ncbi:MAG: hypothetical protein ACOZBW_14845 [Thermodesulfobacteriota bacterium]